MTLEEIKTAVRSGKKVFQGNGAYEVRMHRFKDGTEQWLIHYIYSDYCIGLTHMDGVTMNGKPEEFYTE